MRGKERTGLPTGGTRGDRWSPWGKKKKIRGDQGGPGGTRGDQGGPGGTSLQLSVLRLPIRNFPHFFKFFLPSRPRVSKYRQLTGGKDGTKKVLRTKTDFHNGICKATGGVPSYLLRPEEAENNGCKEPRVCLMNKVTPSQPERDSIGQTPKEKEACSMAKGKK